MESSGARRDTAWEMSEENVELVRRAFEAFNQGGVEAVTSGGFWSPEIVFDPSPTGLPGLGVYRGVDEISKFFEEDFSRMNRGESVFCHGSVLVVINDLCVIDVAIAPFKTNAPLVVDANTVLACALSTQCFKSVARWREQIAQVFGII